MSKNKIYWKGYEELENDPQFIKNRENEFAEDLPMTEFLADEKTSVSNSNRRDFLKFLGFSVTAATLAACETPIKKAIPYVIKPETITPGVPNYYASSYYDGSDYFSVLVKTREGRPIKVDGNKLSGVTAGSSNARLQASVLSLYDSKRAKSALKAGAPVAWSQADEEISSKLKELAAAGKKTYLVTNTIISPSTQAVINDFIATYNNVIHVQYDAVSYQAVRLANQASFGKSVIPSYQFHKANAIASFGADFLNGWLMSGVYAKQYAETRRPENANMSRHYQFESIMSLAGSNADYRVMLKPSQIGTALVALYNHIAKLANAPSAGSVTVPFAEDIAKCGDYLWSKKGSALVVCGINDVNAQTITNEINKLLGSYGNTIDINQSVNLFNGNDSAMAEMFNNISGNAVILYGVNPAYTLPNGTDFNKALASAAISVSFGDRMEETTVQYLMPDHHYLESWNDFNPVAGQYSLQQPTIHPLFDTRAAQESLLVWAGKASRSDKNSSTYREYIKNTWRNTLFASSGKLLFDEFWNTSLHDGVYSIAVTPTAETGSTANISASAQAINAAASNAKGWEITLYEKVGMGTGMMAANPILQELPDPISRVTWDNYITMSPADMDKQEFGFNKLMGQNQWANVAKVTVNGKTLELPVLAQPGQTPGTIGIAIGYGRKFGKNDEVIGANAFPLLQIAGNNFSTIVTGASVESAGKKHQLAGTQTHHTMMGRDIVKETSLKEFGKDPKSGNPDKVMHTNVQSLTNGGHEAPIDKIDYWKDFKMVNHRWGLSIDLNSCNGCGACVVACHVENNVPVVGKDEIRRSRDMHWMRIDRYYTSDADPSTRYEKGNDNYRKKEIPSNSPKVVFQPVMCQHCNHAPCETVCPVLATTHSSEGLNQMTYNRCVGTRYCANNCPYKVRRFNWFQYSENKKFDYYMNDELGKLVLNPDVTVRARGVMEKCSMCVQRIQAGKLEAKKQDRLVKDQEIKTACAEACPTNAIIFGDYNDEAAMIAKLENDPRAYHLLEEVGVKPNVIYQTKVRNVEEEYGHHAHAETHASEGHSNESAHH
jgi:MoCo/4Fe-4S cofactor protein with predicted Tat translocation signal